MVVKVAIVYIWYGGKVVVWLGRMIMIVMADDVSMLLVAVQMDGAAAR